MNFRLLTEFRGSARWTSVTNALFIQYTNEMKKNARNTLIILYFLSRSKCNLFLRIMYVKKYLKKFQNRIQKT